MTNVLQLTEDYILARDLRRDTETIYRRSARVLLEHFGTTPIEEIDHLAVLAWRKKKLEGGLGKRSWNTYSSHLRTVWSFALEQELITHTVVNPFKKTSVIPPKRGSKTVSHEAIRKARNWLLELEGIERCTHERSQVTPAWFWLAVFEVFYYTGIRLNALLHIRYKDIDWNNQMILIRGETEKTHREFSVPIMEGLAPHISKILKAAKTIGFTANDQLFNVNRFSRHYHGKEMNIDQVEAMYRKLTNKISVRMTPHRFRHTIATDLMKQPERNIHLTKSLLNHSNIATTMGYIETDHAHMRTVLHERSVIQGALRKIRREDLSHLPQPQKEVRNLALETPRRLPPPKTLEQISKAMGLSNGRELEQMLDDMAGHYRQPPSSSAIHSKPAAKLSAMSALLKQSFKSLSANTLGSMTSGMRGFKASP